MFMALQRLIPLILLVSAVYGAAGRNLVHTLGAQGVNLWKLDNQAKATPLRVAKEPAFGAQEPLTKLDSKQRTYDFRAEWFEQPLDHFDKSSRHTFHQRFWVNTRHFQPGINAPVIVIDGGETSGEVRFYFLCL